MQSPGNQTIARLTDVRPLPGKLDQTPMFNSNSPEWPKQEGILLSTFPPIGKTTPTAHLGYPLSGEFEIFDHHYAMNLPEGKTLYLALLVQNPGRKPITLNIETAASNLVLPLPSHKPLPYGDGHRASDATLRGLRQGIFPAQLVLAPGQYQLLMSDPIPTQGLPRALNGRSTHIRLSSQQANSNIPALIYVASLAMFGKSEANGQTRSPTLQEWQTLLQTGKLATPRDKTPTPPQTVGGKLVYGRVAGVQQGSLWQANLVDPGKSHLVIPTAHKPISFVLGTVQAGTLGTNQVQTAKLLARYPDTAYEAHGNYCVHYDLSLPLFNPTQQEQHVAIAIETPLKTNDAKVLSFQNPANSSARFAGLVRLRYLDDTGQQVESYVNVQHTRGQMVEPLIQLKLRPQETRKVTVDLLYPPDSTPPQVLTISTASPVSS